MCSMLIFDNPNVFCSIGNGYTLTVIQNASAYVKQQCVGKKISVDRCD